MPCGLKINRQALSSANRIPLPTNGTIGIACGSTTSGSERGKQAALAINEFLTGTRFLANADCGIGGLAELNHKTVVSTTGTTRLRTFRTLITKHKRPVEPVVARDHAEPALPVPSGRAGAFAMDDIPLHGLRASAANPAFETPVDGAIAGMMKSGEFERVCRKWPMSPVQPKGIYLNAPMGKERVENPELLSDKPAT